MDCQVCFGIQHSEKCSRPSLEVCFECHVQVKQRSDHALKCGAKEWISRDIANTYAQLPVVRFTLTCKSPFRYYLNETCYEAVKGLELFSPMCDSIFKFELNTKVVFSSTGFTRIRLPVLVEEHGLTEKIVFMTSHDRTLIAALGSRVVNQDIVPENFVHNTPLVLRVSGNEGASLTVDVHGRDRMEHHVISFKSNKYDIPKEFDLKYGNFNSNLFDAVLPNVKNKKR